MNHLSFGDSFHPVSSFETGSGTGALADYAPVNQPGYYNNINAVQNQAFAYPDGVNLAAVQQRLPSGHQSGGGARLMQLSQQHAVPYLHAVPAQASPQNPTPPARRLTSPPHHLSPNNAASPHPKSKSNSLTPPASSSLNTHPMAAAPLSQQSQSPGTSTSQNQTPVHNIATTPTTPQSPTTANREQSRIALILSINQDLLAEINRLQGASQGGAVNPQQAAQLRNAGQSDKMASEDYIQLLRRVQGNLAYLMPRAGNQNSNNESGGNNSNSKILPGPAFMQHPPQMPSLKEKYEKLRELFPDWVGNDAKLTAMALASSGAGSGSASGSPAQVSQQQVQNQQLQQQQQQQQQMMMQQSANGFTNSTS